MRDTNRSDPSNPAPEAAVQPSRRSVLKGVAGVAGLAGAAGVLAACGSSSSGGDKKTSGSSAPAGGTSPSAGGNAGGSITFGSNYSDPAH